MFDFFIAALSIPAMILTTYELNPYLSTPELKKLNPTTPIVRCQHGKDIFHSYFT